MKGKAKMSSAKEKQDIQKNRIVPISVMVRLFFGSLLDQVGWFFLGLGLIISFYFIEKSDTSLFMSYIFEESLPVTGVITSIKDIDFQEGNHDFINDIHEVHYKFQYNRDIYEGISYGRDSDYEVGMRVPIYFFNDSPEKSHIGGLRNNIYSIWVFFVFIFPIIGLVLIIMPIRKKRATYSLLRYGKIAFGKLKAKTATLLLVNNQTVYKLSFEFTVEGKVYEAHAQTHRPWILEDQHEEKLLYDTNNPSNSMLIDAMESLPKINKDGSIESEDFRYTFAYLFLPFIIIFGSVIAFITIL